jgi:hypothetical protein
MCSYLRTVNIYNVCDIFNGAFCHRHHEKWRHLPRMSMHATVFDVHLKPVGALAIAISVGTMN